MPSLAVWVTECTEPLGPQSAGGMDAQNVNRMDRSHEVVVGQLKDALFAAVQPGGMEIGGQESQCDANMHKCKAKLT